ncbi:MAG TPA: DUF2156 domain-containing protein [Candidatus Nanoarchaeia archaeon]|nr:DUF2156 domain-containing protein [Candidatus Nanoarchaeia archaeon]
MSDEIPEQGLSNLVRLHGGGSLSTSSLQKGMDHFVIPEVGFVSYRKTGRLFSTIVLGNPVVGDEHLDDLIEAFLEEHPKPCFFYIGEKTAEALHKHGFYVNEMGIETLIDLQTYDWSGRQKQDIRTARNRAKKEGFQVVERKISDVDKSRVMEISENWRLRKVSSEREFGFLARSLDLDKEEGVFGEDTRYFFSEKEGRIVGFVAFDPIYRGGKVIGYGANILRTDDTKNTSVIDAIICEAVDTFKREGKEILSLGHSPCYKVDDQGRFKFSRLFKWTAQYFFQHWNHVFEFMGLAGHKVNYCGREEKAYFASRRKVLSQIEVADVYTLTGIDTVGQLVKGYKKGISPLPRLLEELRTNKLFVGEPRSRVALVDDNETSRKDIADQLWRTYRVVEYDGKSQYSGVGSAIREMTHDVAALIVRGDSERLSAGKAANSLRESKSEVPLIIFGNLSRSFIRDLTTSRGNSSLLYLVPNSNPSEIYFEVGIATINKKL